MAMTLVLIMLIVGGAFFAVSGYLYGRLIEARMWERTYVRKSEVLISHLDERAELQGAIIKTLEFRLKETGKHNDRQAEDS